MSDHTRSGIHLPALMALLVSFAAGLYRLAEKSLFFDEAFALDVARRGFAGVISATVGPEPHPPLYYLSLSLWLRLAGDGEFAARYLSTLAGVAVVATVYALSRMLGNRRLAVLAAAFVAVSRYLICYSQEVRMYTLATLLAGLATLSFFSALRNDSLRRWALLAALTSAACYTFYYNLLPAAFLGTVSLLKWLHTSNKSVRRKVWRRAAIAHLNNPTPNL